MEDRLEGRRIADPDLLRYLAGRNFEFEEFDDPELGFGRDLDFVEPPTGEIMKGVMTPGTSIFRTPYSVDLIASTLWAINMAVSLAHMPEVTPRLILRLNNDFEGIKIHGHHYNPVSYLL